MNRSPSSSWSLLASLLLHGAVIGLMLWAGLASKQPVSEVPLALELWSSPPPAPAAVVEPVPVSKPLRVAPPPTPPAPPPEPPAEVNLGGRKKPEPKPQHLVKPPVEVPKKPEPVHKLLPEKPKPEPVKTPPAKQPEPAKKQEKPAKTVEKAPAKPVTPLVTEKKPVKLPPATTPGKGSKQSKTYDNQADDLLSQLDAPNTGHKANARSTQAGSANGVAGGAVNGSAAAKGGWIDKVKAKITPLVQLPPDLSGNPKVVVLVTLLPTLEVSKVQVIGPSSNNAYNEAVQRAIWEARTFPSLPPGANFNDGYRQFKMEFRPR
ncbi:TonB C-terminal domain-containing protein [Aquitalea sp. USM4]|uniref:TonB C-terminal domain-containing protein n=1 Tax=Aquitalea sp. USM4 TaxID=1590041 RepID=UPI00103EB202|nr:TonB C-terminal domain-containing protein [Aquitalea sp. USM4]QBJ77706.1 cell envelope biogenesis protein TolA [Aquitalea sp. USM4]